MCRWLLDSDGAQLCGGEHWMGNTYESSDPVALARFGGFHHLGDWLEEQRERQGESRP